MNSMTFILQQCSIGVRTWLITPCHCGDMAPLQAAALALLTLLEACHTARLSCQCRNTHLKQASHALRQHTSRVSHHLQ